MRLDAPLWNVLQYVLRAIFVVALLGLIFWQLAVLGVSTAEPGVGINAIIGAFTFVLLVGSAYLVSETSRALAAVALRLRIHAVSLIAYEWVREGAKLHCRALWNSRPLGSSIALPLDGDDLLQRLTRYYLAGPLVNTLLGLVLLAIAWECNGPPVPAAQFNQLGMGIPPKWLPWMPQDHTTAWFVVAGIANLYLGLAGLIPWQGSGGSVATYCGYLVSLRRLPSLSERQYQIATLGQIMVLGTRPRLWDPLVVERMLSISEDGSPEDCSVAQFGYYYALDCGDVARAGKLLDRALVLRDRLPPENRAPLFLESAYFEAIHRRNPAAARALLDQGRTGDAECPTRVRAEAAVLLAEGDLKAAEKQIREAFQQLHLAQDRGGALAEQEWLHDMLKTCRAGQQSG